MAAHGEQVSNSVLWGGGRSPFGASYGKQMMWFFLVSDALTFGGLLAAFGMVRYAYEGKWPTGEEVFHSFPFMGDQHLPLIYVAFMTFILIVSSVTMVLAVEAGHRKHKKGVIRWLAATVVGGFIFLGSQVWEWSHFIHGSKLGTVRLEDGSLAKAHAIQGTNDIEYMEVVRAGSQYALETKIEGQEADKLYRDRYDANPSNIIKGAVPFWDFNKGGVLINEYGPNSYAGFFFTVTGFHGFHVFSGVLINLIILINVMRGVYDKRGHFEMVEKVGLYWHFVDLVWVFVFTFFYLI